MNELFPDSVHLSLLISLEKSKSLCAYQSGSLQEVEGTLNLGNLRRTFLQRGYLKAWEGCVGMWGWEFSSCASNHRRAAEGKRDGGRDFRQNPGTGTGHQTERTEGRSRVEKLP